MHRRGRYGFTLAELMIVLAISALLAAMAWPRFDAAIEETRVDLAARHLESIWKAQRLHRLERGGYAATLEELAQEGLVDDSLVTAARPFDFRIVSADATSFVAQARCAPGGVWAGTLVVDQTGAISGSVAGPGGRSASPQD